jgi:hypothetical protein
MTLDLNEVEYREITLDGCQCEISYYRGDSYVTVGGEIYLSLRTKGPITNERLLEEILQKRSEELKHDMLIR